MAYEIDHLEVCYAARCGHNVDHHYPNIDGEEHMYCVACVNAGRGNKSCDKTAKQVWSTNVVSEITNLQSTLRKSVLLLRKVRRVIPKMGSLVDKQLVEEALNE